MSVLADDESTLPGHKGFLTAEQQNIYTQVFNELQEARANYVTYLKQLDVKRAEKDGRVLSDEEVKSTDAARESDYEYELLRFLRARKWNAQTTVESYKDFIAFRIRYKVDSMLEGPPIKAELLSRIVSHCSVGHDKCGRPLYIEKSGKVNVQAMLSCFTDEEVMLGHVWQQENSSRRARENSIKYNTHIETFAQILDLTNLTIAHKKTLKFIKVIAEIDEKYYPERLGRLYIVNAPFIFPLIWAIVKNWIDPVTRSKIIFCKSNFKHFLLHHFDSQQLPSEYGGSCNQCPTAPDCVKEYDITDILQQLSSKEEEMELQQQVIKAGKTFELRVRGTMFGWYVKLAEKDIYFTVEFIPDSNESDASSSSSSFSSSSSSSSPQPIVSRCLIEAGEVATQGEYNAPVSGTLLVTWDNTHAWFVAKSIEYCITSTDDREESARQPDENEEKCEVGHEHKEEEKKES